jgi:hypothetical protein
MISNNEENAMEKEKLTELVRGVQAGDEKAMTEMYESFQKDIYYFIYKTVNDEDLAADLTQDTFIEILQSIHSLKEPVFIIAPFSGQYPLKVIYKLESPKAFAKPSLL